MRRLVTPLGGLLVFVLIAGLVVGGLGWLTVVALRVEAAQIAVNKERLVLWQLDARLFPTLGVETNRPYAHYFAAYIPYPFVLPENAGPNAEPVQVTSPLLSADLPDWMLLHFQIDTDAGWSSPQVIAPEREAKWRAQSEIPIPLVNCTPQRRELLDRLKGSFPKEDVLMTLFDRELSDLTDSPLAVPLGNTAEPQATPVPPVDAATVFSVEQVPQKLAKPADGWATRSSWAAAGDHKPDAAKGTPLNTQGLGQQPPAPGGETPGPPPPAGPASGVGGAAPSQRYVAPLQRQNEPTPAPGNSAAMGRGGTGKQALDPNATNANERGRRQEMLNKVLQDNQARGGNDPSQYGGKPAQPSAEGARPKDAKDAGVKLADASPAPKAAADAPAPAAGTAAFGGLAGRGAAPAAKPPAAPVPPAPAVTESKKAAESERKRADEKQSRGVREADKLDDREKEAVEKAKESSDDTRSRMFYAEKAEPLSKATPPIDPKARRLATGEAARRIAPHLQPPAVHLGPMRPQWLHAPDGAEYLIFVRVAQLETRTVFQGVVLDWSRLQDVLQEEVRPYFPQAKLEPVYAATDASERTMTAIPARLDPGPLADPPPAGWTPLRFGLVIAWVAVLVALAAVAFGGWSLINLSERRIRFVSAVTHELRTPLTSLRLYLDLLTSGMIQEEEKQREYLHTLHGESERLNRLIENVLDFARLEKRSVQAHRQTMKLADLLSQVKETWTDRCAADGKELSVISTLPPDQEVSTDARMAAQVLGNLIDNARKYTREAADRRIWLWAKPGGRKRIVLEVEDRGAGVAASERCSIFRPFRRGQTADTAAGGAGLGLALAKQWAEVLGGSLTCRAADGGVGACFRVELPVK